jgi:hypothetical protein
MPEKTQGGQVDATGAILVALVPVSGEWASPKQ